MSNIYSPKTLKYRTRPREESEKDPSKDKMPKFPEGEFGEQLRNLWIYYKTRAPKGRLNPTPKPRSNATLKTSVDCMKSLQNRKDMIVEDLGVPLGPVELSQAWVDRALIMLERDGKSRRTRNVYSYSIKRFMVANGRPEIVVAVYDYQNDRDMPLHTPEEIFKMINGCDNPVHRYILMFLYYMAPRNGELCAVKRSWVDVDNKLCKIVASKQFDKERVIPIDDEFIPHLKEWLTLRDEIAIEMKRNGLTVPDTLFINQRGFAFKTSGIHAIVSKAAERVGLKSHPHLYRHARANFLLTNGLHSWKIENVAFFIGDTIKMVEDTYGHIGTKDCVGEMSLLADEINLNKFNANTPVK